MGDIFLENKDKQYHSPVMLRDMETKSRPREKAIERGI